MEETRSHYHLIYSKKMPHGIVKVEINLLAPRGELSEAIEEINKILKDDLNLGDVSI